jgi:hypothetical protein
VLSFAARDKANLTLRVLVCHTRPPSHTHTQLDVARRDLPPTHAHTHTHSLTRTPPFNTGSMSTARPSEPAILVPTKKRARKSSQRSPTASPVQPHKALRDDSANTSYDVHAALRSIQQHLDEAQAFIKLKAHIDWSLFSHLEAWLPAAAATQSSSTLSEDIAGLEALVADETTLRTHTVRRKASVTGTAAALAAAQRTDALEWMWTRAHHFVMSRETVQTGIRLLDYVCSTAHALPVPVTNIRLLGAAALSLAAKMEERYVPTVRDLTANSGRYHFSSAQLLQTERLILEHLQWNIRFVTPFSWLRAYLRRIAAILAKQHTAVLDRVLPRYWTLARLEQDAQDQRQRTEDSIRLVVSTQTLLRCTQLSDLVQLHPTSAGFASAQIATAVLLTALPATLHDTVRVATGNSKVDITQLCTLAKEAAEWMPALTKAEVLSEPRKELFDDMTMPVNEYWTRFHHPLDRRTERMSHFRTEWHLLDPTLLPTQRSSVLPSVIHLSDDNILEREGLLLGRTPLASPSSSSHFSLDDCDESLVLSSLCRSSSLSPMSDDALMTDADTLAPLQLDFGVVDVDFGDLSQQQQRFISPKAVVATRRHSRSISAAI